jgi:hypothetical protein
VVDLTKRSKTPTEASPAAALEALVDQAQDVVKKARKHRQKLDGDNFYGNKLAVLRSDASNAFRELSVHSTGDTAALAELIEPVFSADTSRDDRLKYSRELLHSLRTIWKGVQTSNDSQPDENLFPPTILEKTNRTSIVVIGRQMNGSFAQGWYDACAVMMRRLIETSIIEAYEAKGIAAKIKDGNGDYFALTKLVSSAINEATFSLSRNVKKALPSLKDVGHLSAHSRYYHATKDDLDKVRADCRVTIEEFLHHAGLL